jgi:MATE family multidrug resistance protein
LLSFFYDGLSRGAAAVAGNLIGGSKQELIGKMFKAGISLLAIFSLIIALFLVVDSQDTVRILFFDGTSSIVLDAGMQSALKTCMVCAFAYLFFEGIRWLLSGILVAAGDTWFLLIAGSFSVWLFLLLPIYVFVVKMNLPVEYAWMLTVIYSALVVSIYWIRFKQRDWKENDLIQEEPLELEPD